MKAGNTVETLAAVDVNDAVPDRVVPEFIPTAVFDTEDDPRSDLEELRELVYSLFERIERYNQGAPHKI